MFDVFLSYSSKDKDVVREVAEKLSADGLRVWFDERELKPGDHFPTKIDEGLEQSRVLVLGMSENAFGSDWSRLESYAFRFRDPLNKERRFIPLRLDDSPLKPSLEPFVYIDWRLTNRDLEYAKLLDACRPPETMAARSQVAARVVELDYQKIVHAYAFSADGKRALTGGGDNTVRLWDLGTGDCLRVLEGHTSHVWSLAWSADLRRALSGSNDHTVRLWDVETGQCLRLLEGHSSDVYSLAWSPDQRQALSGSADHTVRLWDVESGDCLRVLEGHTDGIWSIAWSSDRSRVLTGSNDKTVRLWDVDKGRCLRVLEGHTHDVYGLAWSFDQRRALSGSRDNTVRLWDVETGSCLRVLEGHARAVESVTWSIDDRLAFSGSWDKSVRLWDLQTGRCLCALEGHKHRLQEVAWSTDQDHAFSGDSNGCIRIWDLSEVIRDGRAREFTPNEVQYTNAKVLLVGDSGVGKTGLSNRLALQKFEETESTDGAWATHWPLPHPGNDRVDREIWLWDFAGQVDYRLVHQLFMDDTAAAVLVFNPQNENPFEGLGRWDLDLRKAARRPFSKLLAAGRVDRGGLLGSTANMQKFMEERGFQGPLHLTSAKTGEGCDQLREAILQAIDWKSIPETTSPALYHRMKQEILHLRDSGIVLIRQTELKQRMEMTLRGEHFKLTELDAVVSLLAGPGMIQRLDFGGFVLLRPEVLSRYAAAVVRKVRKHPQEMGCIREDELLSGDLDYQDFKRLPREDEEVVLRALLETLVCRAWCLRQSSGGSALLTFPSYFRRERKEQPGHPYILVTYRFEGPADDIYATLVVRLHYSVAFQSTDLWKSAADFQTQTGAALGFTLTREAEGASHLEVYFAPSVDDNSRVLFLRYVHDHLIQYAQTVVRLRHYACGNRKCGQPFPNQSMIASALATGGKGKVFCPACGKPIPLRDAIEARFDSPAVKEQVYELQIQGQALIDDEHHELQAIHHTLSIVAEAGQIYRGYTNPDRGIDGEIEFNDDLGRASGKRLYVVFQIKSPLRSFDQHVMQVFRSAEGEIHWQDSRSQNESERLDVLSVRRQRDKALKS